MRTRTLGRTGLLVSELAFGGSPLGDEFGAITSQQANAAVQSAIDAGITLFDVSPYYGRGLAEERLGMALEGKREQIVLCTKCGRQGFDQFDFSASRLIRSVEESLVRLRTGVIDILLLHDVEFVSSRQIREESLPAIRQLKSQGKVRFIGLSGFPLNLLRSFVDTESLDVVLSYCRANLLVNDLPRVLGPSLERSQTGLITASPLHMGMLTAKGPPAWHPAPAIVKDTARALAQEFEQRGVSLARLALQFALRQPLAASVLVGMSSPQDVVEAVTAMNEPVDETLLDEVIQRLKPVQDRVWPSGLPENHDTNDR